MSSTLVGNPHGLQFSLTWEDPTPLSVQQAVETAAHDLSKIITTHETVYIDMYWEPLGSGVVGASGEEGQVLSYQQLQALQPSLPVTDPVNNDTFFVANAEYKALGGVVLNNTFDGGIALNSDYAFSFGNHTQPGMFDAVGVIEHELTETMGRLAGDNILGNMDSVLDLFRFTAPDVHAEQPGGYFSLNNGVTSLAPFSATGDTGDWVGLNGDAFNDAAALGQSLHITSVDLEEMSVLGYSLNHHLVGDLG